MRIAFGTDEVTSLTEMIEAGLVGDGHELVLTVDGVAWTDVGHRVGAAVAGGDAECGIVCCWTGTGVSMAANKVPGVRAALCTDAETARGARTWNDANVLALGLRLTSDELAREIIDAFMGTEADEDERSVIDGVEELEIVDQGADEGVDQGADQGEPDDDEPDERTEQGAGAAR